MTFPVRAVCRAGHAPYSSVPVAWRNDVPRPRRDSGALRESPRMEVGSLFSQVGEAAILELAEHFYEGVASDATLRPMYPPDLAPARDRLGLFLLQRFGGPATYSELRGHPRLRRRHAGFPIGVLAREAWIAVMRSAVRATPALAAYETELMAYFGDTATFLINQ